MPINSFHSVTSTFAETSPHVGIYEDAYDIFVNSTTLVGPGTTEIMIWVNNYNQVPAGTKFATAVALDSRTYDVYYEADNGNGGHYVAFVADDNFSSGTVDLLAFFNYAVAQSWIPATAPLNQVCFGVKSARRTAPTRRSSSPTSRSPPTDAPRSSLQRLWIPGNRVSSGNARSAARRLHDIVAESHVRSPRGPQGRFLAALLALAPLPWGAGNPP